MHLLSSTDVTRMFPSLTRLFLCISLSFYSISPPLCPCVWLLLTMPLSAAQRDGYVRGAFRRGNRGAVRAGHGEPAHARHQAQDRHRRLMVDLIVLALSPTLGVSLRSPFPCRRFPHLTHPLVCARVVCACAGACDGQVACSTCHVIFPQAYYDKLPPAKEDEVDMLVRALLSACLPALAVSGSEWFPDLSAVRSRGALRLDLGRCRRPAYSARIRPSPLPLAQDTAFGQTPTSRLGCQCKVTQDFDGVRLVIPGALSAPPAGKK